MNPILSTVIALVASVLAVRFLIGWARCCAVDAKAAQDQVDVFYQAAQKLIKDPETPDSVITFVSLFAPQIARPKLARTAALHMARGRVAVKPSPLAVQLGKDLKQMPAEQQQAFAQLMMSGMASSAASDPLLSRVYSWFITTFLSMSGRREDAPSVERANTLAMDVAQERNLAAA